MQPRHRIRRRLPGDSWNVRRLGSLLRSMLALLSGTNACRGHSRPQRIERVIPTQNHPHSKLMQSASRTFGHAFTANSLPGVTTHEKILRVVTIPLCPRNIVGSGACGHSRSNRRDGVNCGPGARSAGAEHVAAAGVRLREGRLRHDHRHRTDSRGRLWACWVAGGDSPETFFVLATSDDGESWSKPCLVRGANVFVSTDQGATWERRGCVQFPNPDWHEHMVVERRTGPFGCSPAPPQA